MPSPERITVRVPAFLNERLQNRARVKGTGESEIVRAALESYLGQAAEDRLAYEAAQEAGIVGLIRRAPKDLSTNRRHFEGFGE